MNKCKKLIIGFMTILMVLSVDAGFAQKGNGIPGNVYAETTVYVTRTGKKYHAYACGNGTYYKSTLSAAKARGLQPCKKCNPPTSDSGSSSNKKKVTYKLNKKSATLLVKQHVKLKVKGTSSKVKWTTSNKKVATVSKSGKVTAKAKGKATIKAKVGGKTLACKIKVENPYISDKELAMREGEEAFLEIKGCSHEPEWYCDDYDIVEVEDDGTIFASEAGVTTVYATVHNRIFSCKVTVLPHTEDIEDPDVEIEY